MWACYEDTCCFLWLRWAFMLFYMDTFDWCPEWRWFYNIFETAAAPCHPIFHDVFSVSLWAQITTAVDVPYNHNPSISVSSPDDNPPPVHRPAAVTLKSLEQEKDHRFVIHALQSVPHMSSKSCEYYKMAGLAPGTSYNESFKMEVTCTGARLSCVLTGAE